MFLPLPGDCKFHVFFLFISSIFLKDLFVYSRERERWREYTSGGEGHRERLEGERISSRLPTECRARLRTRSHNPEDHDPSRNQESDTQTTKPPRCASTYNLNLILVYTFLSASTSIFFN